MEKNRKNRKNSKKLKIEKKSKKSKKLKKKKNWKIIKKNYRSLFTIFFCYPFYDTGTHDSLPYIYPMPVLENVRDRVFMVSATCCLLLVI